MSTIKETIEKHGIAKVRALIPLHALRHLLFIHYTSSTDPYVPVLCEVTEEQYKVAENYKIGWKPIGDFALAFPKETYYQGDFDGMVRDGRIKVYVEV
jgi:hypothetical protein